MIIRQNKCLLCARQLDPVDGSLEGLQKHPDVEDCLVVFTDAWGVAVEVEYPDDAIPHVDPEPDFLAIDTFPSVETCLEEIFDSFGLRRLGGASSGRGWTSVSIYQRCPYLWKRKYVDKKEPVIYTEPPARAIGTLVHAFLALYYTGMMAEDHPYRVLEPDLVFEKLRARANPTLVAEAWRVFTAYRLYYMHEKIIPLAIEHDLKDPRTGESCRFDLIAYIEGHEGLAPGTYNFEHKTVGRFDHVALEGWQNDGEVIGQNALWNHLGLDLRFGPLKGTIVNLLGKQKEPRFHRTFVAPDSFRINSHLEDLRRWGGLMELAKTMDVWPRSRGNCISRFGLCDLYDHCASND